ncbi:hypothetical protein Q4595_29670, partial [Wenyingzhuangia sp. 1_MG-2023]|nr:hypothetical protein [Wenyingzhuangia sp. 1_MG-2023]
KTAYNLIALLVLLFFGSQTTAQEWKKPIIKEYGRIKYYRDAEILPNKHLEYKIIFDIKDAKEKDGVNKVLWHIARQINLLG